MIKDTNKDRRGDRRDDRQDHKIDKIGAKTEKALAVSKKRAALASILKWLVILIGVGYLIFKFGRG